MTLNNPVYCALDTSDLSHALHLARSVGESVGGLKIGMEAFYAFGRDGFDAIADMGLPIFLDLKLHDIPNTVARAVSTLVSLGPEILNVHVGGGREMMEAAVDAAEGRVRLIGVTVLTSLNDLDLVRHGILDGTAAQALRLAEDARAAGLDGVVCSAHEVPKIKALCGQDFLTVVPGIRPAFGRRDDQKRTLTPEAALAAGADILVIGRPITEAADPAHAARDIALSLAD